MLSFDQCWQHQQWLARQWGCHRITTSENAQHAWYGIWHPNPKRRCQTMMMKILEHPAVQLAIKCYETTMLILLGYIIFYCLHSLVFTYLIRA